MTSDDVKAVAVLVAIALAILLSLIGYFLPSLIAALWRHRNGAAIFVLNLCLGWTCIGWVVALVWSFTED